MEPTPVTDFPHDPQRLLARVVVGELPTYPSFQTR